jgi:cold shock CspA family protein
MLLSWDFRYQDMNGRESVTRTSQELLEEVTYPVAMHELIDNRLNKNDAVISNLFDKQDENRMKYINKPVPEGVQRSRTLNMKSGYGFIAFPPNNLFFHYEDVLDGNFNEIMDGDMVEFEIRRNERGEEVAYNVRKIEPGLQ